NAEKCASVTVRLGERKVSPTFRSANPRGAATRNCFGSNSSLTRPFLAVEGCESKSRPARIASRCAARPCTRVPMSNFATVAAPVIFSAAYRLVAIGKTPVYRIDRAGAALLGGSLMVGLGILSADEAYQAISFDTLTLLLGMMIVAANLRVSGFFRLVTYWVARHVRRPLALLVPAVLGCGAFSAVLVNDTVCLVMTPLVLDVVLRLKRNPMPYLLAIAMGSNIGSVATITGNPQNMIVASLSQVPYGAFAAALVPVAAAGLVVTLLLIAVSFRGEFFAGDRFASDAPAPRDSAKRVLKPAAVTAVMLALFFRGQPVAKVAIAGGAFLPSTRRVNPPKIYREIDWPLLVMFAGLFIVVAGFEKAIVTPDLAASIGRLHLDNAASLTAVTAGLSHLLSHVPAGLGVLPVVARTP